MTKLATDQAEGLRRLFVGELRRMVALVDGSTPRMMAALLAATLASQGKRVLLLDESLTAGDRHVAFDVPCTLDFDAVLAGRAEIEEVLVHTMVGVDLLAGGGHRVPLPKPAMETRIGLVNAFYRLAGNYDVVLVDAVGGDLAKRPGFAWACQDVIVLHGNHPHSMTETYAHIKALHQAGGRRFHLLFEGEEESRARALFRSIAAVSRRHLELMPEFLGCVPDGSAAATAFFERLGGTVQGWPLPENKAGHFPALMRRLLRVPAKFSPAMAR